MANRTGLVKDVPAPRPEPGTEHTPLAWWHLRSRRMDLQLLARVRAGLLALAPAAAPTPAPGSGSGPASADPAPPAEPIDGDHLAAPVAELPTRSRPGPEEPGAEPDAPAARAPATEPAGQAAAAETSAEVAVAPDGGLTEPAVAAVRSTFTIVAEAGDKVPGYFYGQLFARHPQLRALFPAAMNVQRDRLVKALVRIVESLTTPEEMATYLAQLGRDHRKYGVDPAMYEAVGAALLATLRKFAGPAFTPAAEQAWTDAYAAISTLMIQAADEAGTSAPAFWSAEVVDVEERFRGMSVLTIALDQGMRFEAGQHVTVQHPRWPRVWRPYSIAGRPREDGLVQLHVKAIPGGWVSNALVRHTQPGSELTLGPPLGTMTLSPAGDRDLVCVAGGTGLAPIKAIVEQAVRDSASQPRRIQLFCGARQREELYDLPDLWRLADAWPALQIIPVTSDDRSFDGMQGNVGRVAARYLAHRECEAYVAGPPAMVRETFRMLVRAGLPRTRVHYDDALLAAADPGLPDRAGS